MQAQTVVSPSVQVDLGGRTRALRMDLNAMALIDQETGINLINDIGAVMSPSPRLLGIMTWACLVADDPTLTNPEQGIPLVGSWIDFGNMTDILQAITKAFRMATPEPESVTPNGATPKNQRRGSPG